MPRPYDPLSAYDRARRALDLVAAEGATDLAAALALLDPRRDWGRHDRLILIAGLVEALGDCLEHASDWSSSRCWQAAEAVRLGMAAEMRVGLKQLLRRNAYEEWLAVEPFAREAMRVGVSGEAPFGRDRAATQPPRNTGKYG